MANHPKGQTKAKPQSVTDTGNWKPKGALLGTLRDCNVTTGAGGACWCLRLQKASGPDTIGKIEKFQLGGGEEIDHSRVRPFQGSPVRSGKRSRYRILTTSCVTVKAMPIRMATAPPNATNMSGCHPGSA